MNLEFEEPNDEIIQLKENIIDVLSETDTKEAILSLVCCIIDYINHTAPSRDAAAECIAAISASISISVIASDQAGLCRWNETMQ